MSVSFFGWLYLYLYIQGFFLLKTHRCRMVVCKRDAWTWNFHLSIKTWKSRKVGDFLKRKKKSLLKVKKLEPGYSKAWKKSKNEYLKHVLTVGFWPRDLFHSTSLGHWGSIWVSEEAKFIKELSFLAFSCCFSAKIEQTTQFSCIVDVFEDYSILAEKQQLKPGKSNYLKQSEMNLVSKYPLWNLICD